jgi:glutathione S-transferase
MAITLHRCRNEWVKFGGHPCWRVQKALDEAGIDYELDPLPWRDRDETERRTGQRKYPWIEFEDGSIYREESKEMAQRIKDGKLSEAPRAQQPVA